MELEHTSRLAAAWSADPAAPARRSLQGSAVLTDLSGFTRLTELLDATGAEGAEVLHRVVSTCFHAVLGRSVDLGGDIIAFAGDAALVWFDADEFDDHVQRAAGAASTMPRDLAALPAAMTGGRRLTVSVGVHTGSFSAHLVGTRQRSLFLCGPDVSLLASLQSAAPPGVVAMSDAVARVLPTTWCGTGVGPGFALRRRGRGRPVAPHTPPSVVADPSVEQASRHLVSPDVIELLRADVPHGDHRIATVGFVRLAGLEARREARGEDGFHEDLEHVVDVITTVAADESIDWLDTDVGVDSIKLLLTAGAPRAVDDDEGRMLVALRRIVDECRIPLRAAAQRGRVFASTLGVQNRRGYTVLGDAANVAARALALAGDRDVVVADGLGVTTRHGVVCSSLGLQHMKNRDVPMEVWRVDEVGPRQQTRVAVRGNDLQRAGPQPREHELESLLLWWKDVIDTGSGRVVVIEGEPGFGASELIAATVDHAGGSAVPVVVDPFRQRTPYSGVRTLVAALRSMTGGDDPAVTDDQWLARWTTALAVEEQGWVPLALAQMTQSDSDVIDPMTAATRTCASLAGLIAAALPSPCLLAIDDIDRMDEASRRVVARLRGHVRSRDAMLLVSVSPPSAAFDPADHDDLTVRLEPLLRDDARRMVQELAPHVRHDIVERIVDAGGGNPFVLTELALSPTDDDLPDSLQRLAAWLIDDLPVTTRQLVRDAAVAGTVSHPALLARLLARPELADTTTWQPAASVIRLTPDGLLTFRHDVFRRVAYQALSFERRRELHGRLADLLEGDPITSDATRAQHLQIAGRIVEAYPLAAGAARTAQSTGALVEAVDLFVRAREMAVRLDRGAVAHLLLAEAKTRSWLGDIDGATRCLRSAGRHAIEPSTTAELCHQKADLALRNGAHRTAKRWIDRGLAALAGSPEHVRDRCWLMLDEAARLDLSGRYAESIAMGHQVLDVARNAADELLVGLAHAHLQYTHLALMDEEALDHGKEAVRIFTAIGHDRFLESVLHNAGLMAMYLGRWDEATDLYEQSLSCSRRSGNSLSVASAEMNLGFIAHRRRQFDEAIRRARSAQRTFDAAGIPADAGTARLLHCYVAISSRDAANARRWLAEARSIFDTANEEKWIIDCDVTLVEILLLEGEVGQAVEIATRIEPKVPNAEPETQVRCERLRGVAEARAGIGEGISRVERALASARERNFLYEVYCCLDDLTGLAVLDDLTETEAAQAIAAERDTLGRSLGIATH